MQVKDSELKSQAKPEASLHQQEVFNAWLANYLRRLDRMSAEEPTSVKRPPGLEAGDSVENRKRKQA